MRHTPCAVYHASCIAAGCSNRARLEYLHTAVGTDIGGLPWSGARRRTRRQLRGSLCARAAAVHGVAAAPVLAPASGHAASGASSGHHDAIASIAINLGLRPEARPQVSACTRFSNAQHRRPRPRPRLPAAKHSAQATPGGEMGASATRLPSFRARMRTGSTGGAANC